MSHKNFLMWVFSTLDLSKTREFHEGMPGLHGRCRTSGNGLTPGRAPRAYVSRDRGRLPFKDPTASLSNYRCCSSAISQKTTNP